MNYGPGHIERKFLVVPEGATWAGVVLPGEGNARLRSPFSNIIGI